jgi:hypothetical protein
LLSDVKFEVLTALLLRFQVTWDVMLYQVVVHDMLEVSPCLRLCDTVSSGGVQHVGSITMLASLGSGSPRRRAAILLGLLGTGDAGSVILRN